MSARTLSFRPLPRTSFGALAPLDQRRAAMLYRFQGGPDGDHRDIDALLGHEDTARYTICDEQHSAVAEWWQGHDSGLLFAPGSATPIGEAIQHGFVCRDVSLWREIAATELSPDTISWEIDDEVGSEGATLWFDPPDPSDVLRDLLRSE